MERLRRYGLPALIWLGLVALPLLIPGNYRHNIMALITATAIAAVGLNLLVGVSGQISLGHGAFAAIGGYTTAFLTAKAGLPMWVGVPAGGVVAALVGFWMGLPALRLHGHFLALATLSFGAAVPQIALKWTSVTGGAMGVIVPTFPTDRAAYWTALAVLAALVWVAYNVVASRPGRALLTLRESEVAARAFGVNITLAKAGVFALSAFYAGVSGALTTHLSGFISPVNFGITWSFLLLVAVVVGGLSSIPGAIYGTVVLLFLNFALSRAQGWATVMEGFVIIGVILFLPRGLATLGRKLKEVRSRAAA